MHKMKTATKWKDEFYHQAYRLAREGMTDEKIARHFRVNIITLDKWKVTRPALKKAMDEGRNKDRKHVESFKEYIHGRLPAKARKLWNELEAAELALENGDDAAREAVIELITTQGKRMRQQLFLHALFTTNFQTTMACRRTGISVAEVRRWAQNDDGFAELVKGIHECKKDFFEAALIDLVAKRDSAAVIFVNKTVNKDRGYGDAKNDGAVRRVQHEHRIMLDQLPPDLKRALLENIRQKPQLEDNRNVIDVDVE
jgi:transposase